MYADLLHGGFFSGMTGKQNALVASLRIFVDQGQDFFHTVVVHTRKAFVKDKRDLLVFEKCLDKSQTQTEICQVFGAATEVICGAGGVAIAVAEREVLADTHRLIFSFGGMRKKFGSLTREGGGDAGAQDLRCFRQFLGCQKIGVVAKTQILDLAFQI